MRYFLSILVLLFALATQLYSQNIEEKWEQYIELINEELENEEDIAELIEKFEYYATYPINLNDTNSTDLLQLGFISDFQRNAVKSYIVQNGQLKSIYELQLIHSFSQNIIQLLTPFVYAGVVEKKEKVRLGNILERGKHSFSVGGKRVVEEQKGYTERTQKEIDNNTGSRYMGSPYRTYFKYQFNAQNKILFGLVGEKDAGEEFSFNKTPYGFDYYGGYLMVKDIGIIDKAIVGNYHLQFGQGLTLWTGIGFSVASGTVIKKYAPGIKQASSFSEYGQMQGGATTIKVLNNLKWTLFYSSKKRDAVSVETDENGNTAVFQSFTKTGYHRTESEKESRNKITENIFGTNLQYTTKNLAIGSTIYRTALSADWQPLDRLYNYYAFRGKENLNAGIDFNYLFKQVNLFGEIAMNKNIKMAGIVGLQTYFSNSTSFSSYYRYYTPEYYSLYTAALGQNSTNSNEQGIFMVFQTMLPFQINTTASADIFSSHWMKYQINNPSSFGNDFRLNFAKDIQRGTTLSLQYRIKEKPYNLNEDSIYIRYAEQTFKQGLQIRLNYKLSEEWSFDSRAEYSYYHTESKSKTTDRKSVV